MTQASYQHSTVEDATEQLRKLWSQSIAQAYHLRDTATPEEFDAILNRIRQYRETILIFQAYYNRDWHAPAPVTGHNLPW